MTEVPPVHLGLLGGQRGQLQVRLTGLAGAMSGDDRPEVVGRAVVAAFPDHLEEPAGAKVRVQHELLEDERHIRVDLRRACRERGQGDTVGAQRTTDGAVMEAMVACDGRDRPSLGVEEATDGRLQKSWDHACLRARRRTERKSPTPTIVRRRRRPGVTRSKRTSALSTGRTPSAKRA